MLNINEIQGECIGCGRWLHAEERTRGRVACCACEDGVRSDLEALTGPDGLFARLVWLGADALTPRAGRSSSDPVVKMSKTTAPDPVRLQVVNLLGVGGVVHSLQRWVRAWYDDLGFRPPVWRGQQHFVVMVAPGGQKVSRPGQLDNTVRALLNNLPWACEHRADFGTFKREVRRFVEDAESAIDPTTERRRFVQVGRCPTRVDGDLVCGQLLQADPFAASIRCHNCNTVWPRSDWIDLGQALQSR